MILAQRGFRLLAIYAVLSSSSYAASLSYVLTSRALTWRRYLYVTSFTALISFLNAINFPLPSHLQLPMVLIKLALDLDCGVTAVNCALLHAAEASAAPRAPSPRQPAS